MIESIYEYDQTKPMDTWHMLCIDLRKIDKILIKIDADPEHDIELPWYKFEKLLDELREKVEVL